MERPSFAREDSDDRFAEKINANVEAMSDRRALVRYVLILGAVNLLIWLSVLIFSATVRDGFSQVWGASDRIAKVVLAIVFGIGMWLTYSLFRLKFPDIEEQRLDAGVMGSFAYQSNSTKRWMVWVLSAVGGVVNVAFVDPRRDSPFGVAPAASSPLFPDPGEFNGAHKTPHTSCR